MRILIAGGGVAGTVAGIAMAKAGFDPVVYEAYEESAGLAHGVFLTVAANGLDALAAVDAHGAALDTGFPAADMRFVNARGAELGRMGFGPASAEGAATRTVRRADLYRALREEALRRGVRIEHGKRLVGAEEPPGGGVTARFADGGTAQGDLLVGADGVHSATRRIIDPAAPGPTYGGLGNTGGFTRDAGVGAEPGEYTMIWGRRCFFGYTAAPDGEIWWFANPPRAAEPAPEELRRLTGERIRADLIGLLGGDRTPAARIVAATPGRLRLTSQYRLPHVPIWRTRSMVIIGDAAHAVSPSSGQGASLAAEDAVVLARCLRDLPDVPTALAAYEDRRRERVERVVAYGARMENTKLPGPFGRTARDLALRVVLRWAASPRAAAGTAWLNHHHIDWDRPAADEAAVRG